MVEEMYYGSIERATNGASDGSGSNRKSDGLCER